MNRYPGLLFFSLLIFFGSCVHAQTTKDEQLANQYYQQGEYDKAIVLFEKLYDKRTDELIFKSYLRCLLALKDFDKAEKIGKKQVKKYPDNLNYLVDLGNVYEASGRSDKGKQQYEKAIKLLKGNDQNQVFSLANAFLALKNFDFAIATYLRGRKLDAGYSYNFEIAEVYYVTKEYPKMIDEYLDVLLENDAYIQNVQNSLQSKLSDDQNGNKNEMLRTALLKRIQKVPEKTIFSEMLLWLFVQQKDFESALIQAKALDRRLKEDGSRVFTLAGLCVSNEDYDAAIKAYQYLITKGPNSYNYIQARVELLNTSNKKLINGKYTRADLLELEKEYYTTLNELGKTPNTALLIKGLAHLQAFYLNKTNDAITFLKEIIEMPNTPPQFQAECKLELGDIYLMTGEIWESTLLYSQVDKANKGEPIGEEAKFRNAKLSYYKGDFEWARAQLDVLKGGTSHLIANDALALSLLIQDNMGLDSNITGLLIYAKADLLIFQNKEDAALLTFDSLLTELPGHSLTDEVFMRKAEIMGRKGKYEEEAALLQMIIDKYATDILADDAFFLLADLYEKKLQNKQKAMDLFQELLVKFPGSSYVVEARKRFRSLRGDVLN